MSLGSGLEYDELARKCAAEGKTLIETALACKKSRNAIRKWARKRGVEFSRGKPGPKIAVICGDEARKLSDAGETYESAAKKLGVTYGGLRRWARKHDVCFVPPEITPNRLKGRKHGDKVEVSISMPPEDFATLKAHAIETGVPFSRLVTQLALRQIEQEGAKG